MDGDFLVLSPCNRGSLAHHMTQVTAARVEALRKITAKESVTSGSLMKDQRVLGAFGGERRSPCDSTS